MDTYKPHSKEYNISLHRDTRVLVISEDGMMRMETSDGKNGTKFKMIEYVDSLNMRRSLTLNYKDKPVLFELAKNDTDVRIANSNGTQPYIVEKESFKMDCIAIVNHRFASFALDDYMGNEPGPIKWWELYTDKNDNKNPRPNQWFTIKQH
jgi:hypothetical protein